MESEKITEELFGICYRENEFELSIFFKVAEKLISNGQQQTVIKLFHMLLNREPEKLNQHIKENLMATNTTSEDAKTGNTTLSEGELLQQFDKLGPDAFIKACFGSEKFDAVLFNRMMLLLAQQERYSEITSLASTFKEKHPETFAKICKSAQSK